MMWETQATVFELVLSIVANLFVLLVGFLLQRNFDRKAKRDIAELRNFTAQLQVLRGNDDALKIANSMLRKEVAALTEENHGLANQVVALTAKLERR